MTGDEEWLEFALNPMFALEEEATAATVFAMTLIGHDKHPSSQVHRAVSHCLALVCHRALPICDMCT